MVDVVPALLRGHDAAFCYAAPDLASILLALLLSPDLSLIIAVVPESGKITPNHLQLRSEQADMVRLGAVVIPLPCFTPSIIDGRSARLNQHCKLDLPEGARWRGIPRMG